MTRARCDRECRCYSHVDDGNGDFGDDGAHDLDMACWGLGVATHPVKITAHGSNMFETGVREYPDNMIVSFQFGDGKTLTYEERVGFGYGQNGVDSSNAFYGTCGLIHLGEIAYRTSTVLEFDPQLEKITNSPSANAMLAKEYRKPYGIPDVS